MCAQLCVWIVFIKLAIIFRLLFVDHTVKVSSGETRSLHSGHCVYLHRWHFTTGNWTGLILLSGGDWLIDKIYERSENIHCT